MDAEKLPKVLEQKLNQEVELVPLKKDDGGEKKDKGGEKKDKGGDKKDEGGDKKDEDGKKETVAGDGVGGGGKDDGGKAEANPTEYYGGYTYRIEMVHAPQLFSDENPNGCSVM
ncbi:putative Heavy metal-associated isoprenylated plant protein 3 [Cocos nucifera]|nr:putative Heavy metal-associated isoprenylated plant protein 3 [Cocos nucifera]